MPESCTWCGESEGTLKTITVETSNRLGTSTREETMTVHPEHEAELRAFAEQARRYGGRFLLLSLLFGLFIPISGVFAGIIWTSDALITGIVGLSIIVLGVVMYVYPFATPETVDMLGVKSSQRLVRILSIVTAALGGWILWMGVG